MAKNEQTTKQLTLRLPVEYHRKLKILAACCGKSMTEIIVSCIDARLQSCLQKELAKVEGAEPAREDCSN
ncbi:MAG: hypothetical protein EOM25_10525 [Deltaproteobacteria bacterium]|nr:hypothetical protein [Deltaproteobacteria bacterium]